MPKDSWSNEPTIAPHGTGFSIPVGVTSLTSTDPESGAEVTTYDGVRIEARSLSSVDIAAAVDADPDTEPGHLTEALSLANDQHGTLQAQIDVLTDAALGGN